MSQIQLKFDNQLQQSDIIIHLTNSSKEESGNDYQKNQQEIQQTLIYGIQSPLIMINNIVIDFADILNFELKCTDISPTVSMTVMDRYKLISIFDTPSIDNELRIQILPKFEQKYKKINLTFYITNIRINNNYITLQAEYKLPKFTASHIQSFGEIDSYQLFETIAKETQLGFVTNIEENPNDKRWIYCDNKSYEEILNKEIKKSGTELQICDFWIDWWNNLVLVDIYERYNSIDKDEDMKIWIAGPNKEINEGIEIEPQLAVATLTNHPSFEYSELFFKNYSIINQPGSQKYFGTDKVFSIYNNDKKEYFDFLIQDGDTKKDIFTKYEYLGECYGEGNYLLTSKKRDTFLQKIQSNENIEIVLKTPLLGIMRGNKINILYYVNDSRVDDMKTNFEKNQSLEQPNLNIPLTQSEYEVTSDAGHFMLDESVSGQYLIRGCIMQYYNNEWNYKIILCRPTSMKTKLIKENE